MAGLAAGDYYLAQTSNGGFFSNGFSLSGTAGGNYNINVNGVSVTSGVQAGSSFNLLRFSVSTAPEPGTLGLLALGGVFGFTRRRCDVGKEK
jgi:hypothetical protein